MHLRSFASIQSDNQLGLRIAALCYLWFSHLGLAYIFHGTEQKEPKGGWEMTDLIVLVRNWQKC